MRSCDSIRLPRAWAILGAAALLAAAFVMTFVSRASAAKGVVDSIGQQGAGDGEFEFPTGVAVNQASGDVYVADAATTDSGGGQRIEQFTADGEFVRAWGWGVATGGNAFEGCTVGCQSGVAGSGEGQFSLLVGNDDLSSGQIAVDQSDGSVYVADNGNDRIQKFTADGAFVAAFGGSGSGDGQLSLPQGAAVDPSSGDVYVADTGNNRIQRFTSSGAYVSQVGTAGSGNGELLGPYRVAVDSTGRVYVLDLLNGRVQRFTEAGAFDQVFAASSIASPRDLAVDPASDHVYVAASSSDFTTQGIFEFSSAGTQIDVHAPNLGVSVFSAGLAVRSSTGRIYGSSLLSPKAMLILDDVSQPTASMSAVSDVTENGATFSGTVNPQGPPVASYHLEYSIDGVSWTPVPSTEGISVGAGTSDVAVSQTASDLESNKEYRARLVATKAFNAANVSSNEVVFITDPAPPLVRRLGVGDRTTTAARLAGEVNPQNSPTTAFVEYTLEPDVDFSESERAPLSPDSIDVGGGNAFVKVTQFVTGLQAGTAYRFRFGGTNQAGTTFGTVGTFATRGVAPPSARRYELVSPQDKNGVDIDRNAVSEVFATSGAADSGNAVGYSALGQFAGIGSGATIGQYRSVRGTAGWSTRGVSPPLHLEPVSEINTPSIWFLSEDLSRAVVSTNVALVPATSSLGGIWGLYLQDNTSSSSAYTLLSAPASSLPPQPPLGSVDETRTNRFILIGASEDMRHVVFDAGDVQLTPDGVEPPPDVSPTPATVGVYEWVDGQVRFVSKRPSGEPLVRATGGSGAGTGSTTRGSFHPGDHPVSDDGQRIYFSALAPDVGLYVRENGSTTRLVSSSEHAGDDPSTPQPATFQAARASDGGLALFTSTARLTQDATGGPDLYLWDASAPDGDRLTNLTTADPNGGGVLGVAGAAEDLSRVYFAATGDLADGAIAGRPNLYIWVKGDGVRHVATLMPEDAQPNDKAIWSVARNLDFRDARASEDGSRALFASRAAPTATDTGGTKQIYLYDAKSELLECVSCPLDGSTPTGDSWLFYPTDLGSAPFIDAPHAPYRLPRNLSNDGRRTFFETDQRLVAADTNGMADVYQWENGELSLISSGRSSDPAQFIDASASGDDVFFTTRDRLVGWDVDSQVDVYDARVGGGFPEPLASPECKGDPCQGELATPPATLRPESSAGTGDVRPKRPTLTLRRLSPSQRRAFAAGREMSLVAKVNTPGRVSARATAKLGKRTRAVARATVSARGAGRVRLGLRLSKQARRALADGGTRLRVTIGVRFAGLMEKRTVILSAPEARGGRH